MKQFNTSYRHYAVTFAATNPAKETEAGYFAEMSATARPQFPTANGNCGDTLKKRLDFGLIADAVVWKIPTKYRTALLRI